MGRSTWRSGKRLTARRIARLFPPHETYVEPFFGRGSVFFANPRKPKRAVINDIDCGIVRETKGAACSIQDRAKCDKITDAERHCGKDWTAFLRHDSKKTLFYLDPPFEDRTYAHAQYDGHTDVKLDDVLRRARSLKGKVALSYSAAPEYRKKICRRPFRCRTLRLNAYSHWTKELLATKGF